MKTEKTQYYTILTADEGKTFKRIADGEILGAALTLGVNDSAANYQEVDAPQNVDLEESDAAGLQ